MEDASGRSPSDGVEPMSSLLVDSPATVLRTTLTRPEDVARGEVADGWVVGDVVPGTWVTAVVRCDLSEGAGDELRVPLVPVPKGDAS